MLRISNEGSYMLATFLGINVLSYILKDAILLSLVSTMKIKIILNILEVLMLNLRKRLTSQCMQFGLIWDGDSVETCSGAFGDYLKFNNPHKTSLYLSMELPVFIWDKAALADFIVDNRIGYAVGSIKEMQEIVDSMTIETYKQISENTKIISQKIRTGSYFRDVLEEVIDDLKTR